MSINKGLTLFTSASRPKYAADVLNVLALPAGASYQFRYETKYVTAELRNEFENLAPSGTRALIVFRDETADQLDAPFMVPVRWAVVTEVELISDFYVIRFTLGTYPVFAKEYHGDRDAIVTLCRTYLRQLGEAERHLPIQLGLTPLVEPRGNEDRASWINVAKGLAHHPGFSTTHFVRIARIANSRDDALPRSDEGEYTLAERQYAMIQLDYFAVNYGTDRTELRLTTDQTLIRVASIGNITLDSRYDSRKVWVQAGGVPGRTATELEISTHGVNDSLPQTALKLPFLVRQSRRVVAYKVLTSTVGACLIATPAILGPGTPALPRILIASVGALILATGANMQLTPR